MSKPETAIEKRARMGAELPEKETVTAVMTKPTYSAVQGDDAPEDKQIPFLNINKGIGNIGKEYPADKGKFILGTTVLGKELNVIFGTIIKYWLEQYPGKYDSRNICRRFRSLPEANAQGLANQYSQDENYVVRAAMCVLAIEVPESVESSNIPFQFQAEGKTYAGVKFNEKKKGFELGISPVLTKYENEVYAKKDQANQLHDYTWKCVIKDLKQGDNFVPTIHTANPVQHSKEISAEIVRFLKLGAPVEVEDDGN